MKRRGSSAERNTAKSQNPKRPNNGINKKKRGQNNEFMRSDVPQVKVKQKKLKVGGRGWGCVDEDGGCHRDEGSPVRDRDTKITMNYVSRYESSELSMQGRIFLIYGMIHL